MFSVLFEVHPRTELWDAYLHNAKMLRPELEQVPGFIDNIRYKSLTREGWLLSLSGWRDEKSVVRWRTRMRHHEVQEKGRNEILSDYHLRVGQITSDTHVPDGYRILEQRLDETEVGEGRAVALVDVRQPPEWVVAHDAAGIAMDLGFDPAGSGNHISWDVFEAVLSPGDIILLVSWKEATSAREFAQSVVAPPDARIRTVRVVRDYGMFDRREAPQYYPDTAGRQTIQS